MKICDNDGTGHPRRMGYQRCATCDCWRPLGSLDAYGRCREWTRCESPVDAARQTGSWDANGTPTGIDVNGDAA